MKNKPKINSIPYAAIRHNMFYPLGEKPCSYALLDKNIEVISEASGWSLRLAKKKCLKKLLCNKKSNTDGASVRKNEE